MVPEQPRNNGAFQPQPQIRGVQPAIDDVKCLVSAADSEKHRVFGECFRGKLAPPAARKRLIHVLVVQFRPKHLLERIKTAKVLQQLPNRLMYITFWLRHK